MYYHPPPPHTQRVEGQRVVAGVDRSSITLLMMMDGRTAESENREKSDAGGIKKPSKSGLYFSLSADRKMLRLAVTRSSSSGHILLVM